MGSLSNIVKHQLRRGGGGGAASTPNDREATLGFFNRALRHPHEATSCIGAVERCFGETM